jgi:hypothetical protein
MVVGTGVAVAIREAQPYCVGPSINQRLHSPFRLLAKSLMVSGAVGPIGAADGGGIHRLV